MRHNQPTDWKTLFVVTLFTFSFFITITQLSKLESGDFPDLREKLAIMCMPDPFLGSYFCHSYMNYSKLNQTYLNSTLI